MKVYGELIKAQLENLASNPSSPVKGLLYWNTSSEQPAIYDLADTTWRFISMLDKTETLSNKTLSSPSIATPVLTEFSEHVYDTTPSNPAAGRVRLYFKNDDNLYKLTSAGVESQVGSGGTAASADGDTAGIVKTFVPEVKASVNLVSASYTVLDDDGYLIIGVTTSSSGGAKTVTFPTAADNEGRWLTIFKVDTGTEALFVDAEGSETINGSTSATKWRLYNQYDSATFYCDGTQWLIESTVGQSDYDSQTMNGSGDYSGGTGVQNLMKMVRVGHMVTLTWGNLVHSSTTQAATASGFIPANFRPWNPCRSSIGVEGGSPNYAVVSDNGTFTMFYTAGAQTGSDGGTISYVAENI